MKATGWLLLSTCLVLTHAVSAENLSPDTVVIARGDYEITVADVDARMSRFPPHERAQFVRDPANLARLLDRLVMDHILSSEARELKVEDDPAVRRDIELAIREVLSTHRMNRFFAADAPDFSEIARERYLADPDAFAQPEVTTVEHVLISTGERSDEDALKLAQDVYARARANPQDFATLVEEFSEDPSKRDNRGRFVIDDPSIYDPGFIEGASALTVAGTVGEPVKSRFGYHVIRLVERTPARTPSFEEINEAIVRRVERDYRENVRTDYLAEVRTRHPETGNAEVLRQLPARYGGRPEDAADGE